MRVTYAEASDDFTTYNFFESFVTYFLVVIRTILPTSKLVWFHAGYLQGQPWFSSRCTNASSYWLKSIWWKLHIFNFFVCSKSGEHLRMRPFCFCSVSCKNLTFWDHNNCKKVYIFCTNIFRWCILNLDTI